ncbi:MAG: hypothetical protein H7Z41_08515 [Cytophagales bacterium]|nr:hypothetical protein [Armatimonadota bacterium]
MLNSVKCASFLVTAALLSGTIVPAANAAAPPVKKGIKPTMSSSAYLGSPVSAAAEKTYKAELVARVRTLGGQDQWPSRVVEEMMAFKLSEAGWQLMLSEKGVKVAFGAARDINDYAKRVGLGDLEQVESANNNDRAGNQGDVGELLATLKPVIALTFEATQPNISPAAASLILRAFATIPEHMDRGVWKPAGGQAKIRVILSPDAADTTVVMNPEKTSFSVTTSSRTEMPGWSTKIEKGLDRGK